MVVLSKHLLLAWLYCACSAAVQAASFDCAKARSVPEQLICGDHELSALDDEVAALYAQVRSAATGPEQTRLKADQLAAWREREKNCADRQCVLEWLGARKVALHGRAPAPQAATGVQEGAEQTTKFNATARAVLLPDIRSTHDFVRVFGACGEDTSDVIHQLPITRVAATCVVRDNKVCARLLDVGRCNLLRYAFNDAGAPILAFVSISGRNAVARAFDSITTRFGPSVRETQRQSQGYAVYEHLWLTSGFRIETTTMLALERFNLESTENVALVWVIRN